MKDRNGRPIETHCFTICDKQGSVPLITPFTWAALLNILIITSGMPLSGCSLPRIVKRLPRIWGDINGLGAWQRPVLESGLQLDKMLNDNAWNKGNVWESHGLSYLGPDTSL